ncbi:MAG: hypothetical protein WCA00_10995 [Candidatus Acidiferrales bacterium]
MKRQFRGTYAGEAVTPTADILPMFPQQAVTPTIAARGLSSHVRQLRKRNQGISRWLALAVVAGAIVALAFVQLAIH